MARYYDYDEPGASCGPGRHKSVAPNGTCWSCRHNVPAEEKRALAFAESKGWVSAADTDRHDREQRAAELREAAADLRSLYDPHGTGVCDQFADQLERRADRIERKGS